MLNMHLHMHMHHAACRMRRARTHVRLPSWTLPCAAQLATIKIPRIGEPGAGLVYVRYEEVASAIKAKGSLHQRLFDGSVVSALFIPEGAF